MQERRKLTVYERTLENGSQMYYFALPTDDLGFSYHIIRNVDNEPTIETLEHALDRINLDKLSPVTYGTLEYNRFISLLAAIELRRQTQAKNKPELSAASLLKK